MVAILFIVVAFGAERGTEIVKVCLRWLSSRAKFLSWTNPSGYFSMAAALAASYYAAFGFDMALLNKFALFKSLDPELVKILTMFITWGLANMTHQVVKKSLPSPGQK